MFGVGVAALFGVGASQSTALSWLPYLYCFYVVVCDWYMLYVR